MAEREIPPYVFQAVETRWQKVWEDTHAFRAPERPDPKNKYYVLEMFPYPSGNLHMGHVRNYAIGDLIARYQRLKGKQVLHPMGWDALGLPAENAAIKDGIHPRTRTASNVEAVKRQFKALGISYDWDREIGTWQPEYYRWNQWFFLKFLEKGLIYKRQSEVNWCPGCETVLANEQVVDGKCWRCDSIVEKKAMAEWSFRITNYAQALLDGIEELVAGHWPDRVTTMQRNWIGRSTGLECDFAVESAGGASSEKIRIFTTRADTIHGATYVVLAPEHALVAKIVSPAQKEAVEAFAAKMKATDKMVRTAENAPKEGVDTGAKAINPFTGEKIPVFVANFVLADYGTGAVMSVPAHDQRDFEFAKKYELPIRVVIGAPNMLPPHVEHMETAFTEDGLLISSGDFTGQTSEQARAGIAARAEKDGFGVAAVKWHLRDWGFSRQRYWGTPIPIVYCPKDGTVPLREQDLPVLIPDEAPLGKDKVAGPPLSRLPAFVNTTCWKCGGPAKREVETMDTFVDSTWYFARFLDPKNATAPFRRDLADAWLPVDIYIGGPEHAVLHLLYFRFWTMVMKELGLVAHGEPVKRLLTQGIVYKDGAKMSKSRGNVVNPDDYITKWGADTFRTYLMFLGPFQEGGDFRDAGISGPRRYLDKVWDLVTTAADPDCRDAEIRRDVMVKWNQTIKKVTEAIEGLHYNTAIAAQMELVGLLREQQCAEHGIVTDLVKMIAPFAPHFAEECWERLGHRSSVFDAPWPTWDEALTVDDMVTVAVQVNGRTRATVTLARGASEDDARTAAMADASVARHLADREIRKVIWVPGRMLSFVVT